MNKFEASALTIKYWGWNGEFVCIIGSSGCDMVFQHYLLFPWMTARNNVAFGVRQVKRNLFHRERLNMADNAGMDAEQTKNFVDKYWRIAYNHQKGGKIPHETVKIASLTDLQQKAAVAAGLDFSGYSHTISANFIKHIYNSHSDANKEESRGNNPVTDLDISSDMPLILNFPDYIITGVIYKNEQRVIYGKTGNGTMFVLEHPQTGNKTLSAISFYKSKGIFNAKELIEQLRKDKRFDFSNVKVTDGTGGNPRSNGASSRPAAATSAEPSDTSLSPSPSEKSRGKNAPADPAEKIKTVRKES